MSLNERIKRENARARVQVASLRKAETETFTPCDVKYLGENVLLIRVSPISNGITLVTVGRNPYSPLAQNLACGVLLNGKLVKVARTGGGCFFEVTLVESKTYSLRFVDEIRAEIDREILRLLNDFMAHKQLSAQSS